MTEHTHSDINREEKSVNDAQQDQQTQQVADYNEDHNNAPDKRSPDQDDYPIRVHDPDIENVVGLGYD